MPINRAQCRRGMSLREVMSQYGSEVQCIQALERLRWPQGLRCPKCAGSRGYRVPRDGRVLLPCAAWHHRASPTAGTMMDSSRLPLGGVILLDGAYLGVEEPSPPGRGSPNQVPLVTAVERPRRVKMNALTGFTS